MIKATPLRPFWIFFLVSFIQLGAILTGLEREWIGIISKALLIPSLLIPFFILSKERRDIGRNLVLLALLLSCLGDVTLMLQERNADFFLVGLICFLIAHIFYAVAFNLTPSVGTSILKRQPWWFLIFLAFGTIMFFALRPGLGAMLIPVCIYMAVILMMALSGLNRYGRVPKKSFLEVFCGALLFLASDALLALDKFREPVPFADFLIFLTYLSAQFLITLGVLDESGTAQSSG